MFLPTLNWLEVHLANRRFLFGEQITEADPFPLATPECSDAVYASLFRCTRWWLVDYTALWAYVRDVYSWSSIAKTVDFEVNLKGYFLNDTDTNPHRIAARRRRCPVSTPPARC